MGQVANFFSRIIKSIPVLLAKVGTIILLIFTAGLFTGYLIAVLHLSPILLAVPVISMFVMWYKLDEGVLVLLLLGTIVIFFPQVTEAILRLIA
jgi:uncharacterized protein YacL